MKFMWSGCIKSPNAAVSRTPCAGRENQVPSDILTTVGGQSSLAFVPADPLLPPSQGTAVASDRGFSGTAHVSNICCGQKCQPALRPLTRLGWWARLIGGPARLVSPGHGPSCGPATATGQAVRAGNPRGHLPVPLAFVPNINIYVYTE